MNGFIVNGALLWGHFEELGACESTSTEPCGMGSFQRQRSIGTLGLD